MKPQAFLRANSRLLISLFLTAVVITVLLVSGGIGGGPSVSFGYDPGPHAVIFVNDATGDDDSNCLTASDPCKTIGVGITKTSAGGTVNVAAGNYGETVSVTKALTLQGEGNTTIIKASSGNSVELRASDITIDNLKIAGASDGAAIRFLGNVAHDDITISNNTFDCAGTDCVFTCGTTSVCPSTASLSVTGNTFSEWGTHAVRIGEEVTSSTVSLNNFLKTGPSVVALVNLANGNTVNAINNFWGKASGPGGTGAGDGGNIVENTGTVTYRPWLLVQDGGTFGQTIVLKSDPGDWTLFSAPQLLSAAPTVTDDEAGAVSMLAYVGAAFISPGDAGFDDDVKQPVSAFFVKATNKAGIGFKFLLPSTPQLASKALTGENWNLIGTNNTAAAQDELSSIQSTPFTGGLVTLFVPDTYNDSGRKDKGHIDWTTDGDRDLNANPITGLPSKSLSSLDGYWAFLDVDRTFSKQAIVD